ncbi:MAG TPA: tRNA dihydrouridine(16) synthase DusC [Gammaproteobacteria bacterium]|nr:tRNA dihydrouridine(16) synthase DusC [Gammaproteobacteria bacterium]
MKLLLAPMEGIIDCYMRKLLTEIGGYDACVTEFIRVVDHLIPEKVFYRYCPELRNNGQTASGTPVIVQLLGSNPGAMAENACRAVEMGAPGIDLNFGCPAKCVNKKSAGAFLLQEPEKLFDIISTVRNAVDHTIPVSAKIRLGYDSTELALENAHAVQSAGANFITVHARTKADKYQKPARWEWLAKINQALDIPMINNGDINCVEDFKHCIEISGSQDIMIGRGAVSRPDLAKQIKSFHNDNIQPDEMSWDEVKLLLINMAQLMKPSVKSQFIVARIKQWLVMLKREYQEARACFDDIRHLKHYSELEMILGACK